MAFGGFVSTTLGDSLADDLGAQPSDFIKSRTYIGGVGTSTTLDQWGDFNGTASVSIGPVSINSGGVTGISNQELDLIPSIARNFGFGILVGQREGPWAVEVSYWRSDHTGTYISSAAVTFTAPSRLEAINLDFKRYLFTQLPTQPFVSLGLSFPWLFVRQGSQILDYQNPPNISTGQRNVVGVSDEIISGFGFNAGIGLEVYVDNNFSVLGGAYERFAGFNQVNGAEKFSSSSLPSGSADPSQVGSLEGNGLNIYVGTTFGFQ